MNKLGTICKFFPNATSLARRSYSLDKVEKSMNQVLLLGRVGVDPQMRGSEDRPVTIFTLATNTNYKDTKGDLQQKTEWHRISVFKPYLRDSVYNYLRKGQRCLIQGKIAYGQITDSKGINHSTSTIVADDVVFFPKGNEEKEDSAFRSTV